MKICCIGAGYVGGPTMAMIALKAPDIEVRVVDMNAARIAAWNSDTLPSTSRASTRSSEDPGQGTCTSRRTSRGAIRGRRHRLRRGQHADQDLRGRGRPGRRPALHRVGGPDDRRGATGPKIIVEKSTIPVKTAETIKDILAANGGGKFQVLSNPEFLAEGTAIADLLNPDRVLIGGERTPEGEAAAPDAGRRLRPLGAARPDHHDQPLVVGAFEARRQRLPRPADLVDQLDLRPVRGDRRRRGRGGQRDRQGLAHRAEVPEGVGRLRRLVLPEGHPQPGLPVRALRAARGRGLLGGRREDERLAEAPVHGEDRAALYNTVADKKIAVLGFAFKKDTNDTRESPAIAVCRDLIAEQARVVVYDPKVPAEEIRRDVLGKGAGQSASDDRRDAYEAAAGAHALAIATEWDEFKALDFARIYASMSKPAFIFDGRNILDLQKLREIGFRAPGSASRRPGAARRSGPERRP
jgi:UDPglucose 6-dehydrogenase